MPSPSALHSSFYFFFPVWLLTKITQPSSFQHLNHCLQSWESYFHWSFSCRSWHEQEQPGRPKQPYIAFGAVHAAELTSSTECSMPPKGIPELFPWGKEGTYRKKKFVFLLTPMFSLSNYPTQSWLKWPNHACLFLFNNWKKYRYVTKI